MTFRLGEPTAADDYDFHGCPLIFDFCILNLPRFYSLRQDTRAFCDKEYAEEIANVVRVLGCRILNSGQLLLAPIDARYVVAR